MGGPGDFGAQAGTYPGRWFKEDFARRTRRMPGPSGSGPRRGPAIEEKCRGKTGVVTEEKKPRRKFAAALDDHAAARGQRPPRPPGQADAADRAAPLRASQGAHLSPNRFARLPEDYIDTVKQSCATCSDPSLSRSPPKCCEKAGSSRTSASSTTRRSPITSPSCRRSSPEKLDDIERKVYDMVARRFLSVFYPAAEFEVTTRITGRGREVQDRGQDPRQAGLARDLWPPEEGEAEIAGRLVPAQTAAVKTRHRGQGERDQPAGALHRSDAALRDGRRGQAGRGRGTARSDAREGPRHAGDPRRDHRGPDLRGIPRAQGRELIATPRAFR